MSRHFYCMKINVGKVLQAEKERLSKPKPLPRVVIAKKKEVRSKEVEVLAAPEDPLIKQFDLSDTQQAKEFLLHQLEMEMILLKKDRAKISSRAATMVEELEASLRKESPAMADDFLEGKLARPELVNAYNAISNLSDQIAALYDKMEHVRQFGELPSQGQQFQQSENIDALRNRLIRLKDNIYKAKTKLAKHTPKNPSRRAMWEEEIARGEAEREDIRLKIKRLTDGKANA